MAGYPRVALKRAAAKALACPVQTALDAQLSTILWCTGHATIGKFVQQHGKRLTTAFIVGHTGLPAAAAATARGGTRQGTELHRDCPRSDAENKI